MSPTHNARCNAILNGWQIFGVALLAFGLAYGLIPKDGELVERLVEDGRHDRARELIVLSDAGSPLANANSTKAGSEILISRLLDKESGKLSHTIERRIATLIEIANDTAATRALLDASAERFSPRGRADCLVALAKHAMQRGKASIGAEIYAELWELELPDDARLRDMVAANRFAEKPRAALGAINRYLMEQGLPFSRLPEDLRMTTVSLHREINDGSRAFDLLSEEFFATVDDITRRELIDLMTETAAQSQRIEDCLPILEKYVASLDPSARDWRELYAREAPHADDADFHKYASILAQYHEWRTQSAEAFELYLKLAAMGDLKALDRCITIYPWIYRQQETTELLTSLAPFPQRPRYTMLTARLEADRGNLDTAIDLMAPLLHERTNKTGVDGVSAQIGSAGDWLEFAHILDAAGRYDDAISAYRKVVVIDDSSTAPLQFAARLLVALGRNEEALEAWSAVSAADHDLNSLQNYLTLANALADDEAARHALQLRIEKRAATPHVSDYQSLSELWLRRGEPEKAIAVARSGVDAMPKDRNMHLHLIDRLIEARYFDDASDEIARYDNPSDTRFSARLLQIAGYVSEPHRVLGLLQRRTGDLNWSPGQRIDLAALYETCNYRETAIKLYRSTRGGEADALRLQALQANERGDLAGALSYQRRFLQKTMEADYEDWMFFGDLLSLSGESAAARKAYQHALDVLRGKISRSHSRSSTAEALGTSPAGGQSRSG